MLPGGWEEGGKQECISNDKVAKLLTDRVRKNVKKKGTQANNKTINLHSIKVTPAQDGKIITLHDFQVVGCFTS